MKNIKNAPSLEQWQKLYEVACRIKEQAPWDLLWDNDLFTIMLPDEKEPVFISVLGRGGECYGIGVYPGYESVGGYFRMLECTDDSPQKMLSYQKCFMCYYGSRSELVPEELAVIKSLGYKFRGADNWIYFRAMSPSCYPWFIDADQAEIMINAMQNFFMAFKQFTTGKLKVDFEGGETFMRTYSEEQDMWLNFAHAFPHIPALPVDELPIKDELLLRRLKDAPSGNMQVEIEIINYPDPVQNDPAKAPFFPRIVAFFERKSMYAVRNKLLDSEVTNAEGIAAVLADFIKEHGKPAKIFVRDEYIARHASELFSALEIPLKFGKGMPCADHFIKEMSGISTKQ